MCYHCATVALDACIEIYRSVCVRQRYKVSFQGHRHKVVSRKSNEYIYYHTETENLVKNLGTLKKRVSATEETDIYEKSRVFFFSFYKNIGFQLKTKIHKIQLRRI